jgi:isopentenyl diphosphate isomerase/L-lactate dehydrogenase-like FMN-dependent dehydrogenase
MSTDDLATWHDLERAAQRMLDPAVHDFIAGGAEDERTLRRNRRAFSDFALSPAAFRDVSAVDARVTAHGAELSAPLLVAPMGGHRLVHDAGELATARGAAAAGVATITSTASNVPMEEEAQGNPARWFQLYVYRDRGITKDLIARAADAGYQALVITADTPVLGFRRRDLRNRFQPQVRWANIERYAAGRLPDTNDGSAIMRYIADQLDPALTWADVEAVVAESPLPVHIKGIMRPADARRAVEAGASGVYVSNHGGRQLDLGLPTLAALPAIADAVAGRATVLLDGGVRSASDVLLALALGADLVAVGRPVLWGLAAAGPDGVRRYLDDLVRGVRAALALIGVRTPAELDRSVLHRRSGRTWEPFPEEST